MQTDPEFEEFARARTPALYRHAVMLCGDRHEAEDLVQETLGKVYVRWHRRFGGRIDHPAAYAQTTLSRTFISSRRKRSSTERPTEVLPERPFFGDGAADVTGLVDDRMVLTEALGRLAPLDRAVLVLRYLEDVSVTEAAEQLGVSPGAVRTRTSRALDKVRDVLDPEALGRAGPGTAGAAP